MGVPACMYNCIDFPVGVNLERESDDSLIWGIYPANVPNPIASKRDQHFDSPCDKVV